MRAAAGLAVAVLGAAPAWAALPTSTTPPAASAPVLTPPGNVCVGGNLVQGEPPVAVRLRVSPVDGAVIEGEAIWRLSIPLRPAPMIWVEFPLRAGAVAAAPDSLTVITVAGLKPPPSSSSAAVVLLADGVEKARRPWDLYARAVQAVRQGRVTPQAFFGSVPFNAGRPGGTPEAGLAALYAGIGKGTVKVLQARVVGDDGTVIGDQIFSLGRPGVRDAAAVAAALKDARIKAAAPGHCAPQAAPGG